MSSSESELLARAFFDEFVEAFRSFDGNSIASRYLTPYLAFHTPQSIQILVSHNEVASYFQQIVDEYYAKGCRTCRYKDMSVTQLGNACVVGTVTWELLTEEQAVISAWRESYNLCLVKGRFKVFTSTDHAA